MNYDSGHGAGAESIFRNEKSTGSAKGGTTVPIGQVVIIKIGLNDAVEVTAYGQVVNNVAKNNRQENGISVSNWAWNSWKKPLPRIQEPW
jgi:hypothetical protein